MPQTSREDVIYTLKKYGITNPDPSEVDIFVGMDVVGGAALAAISEYANFKKQEALREANDPLAAYQTLTQKMADDSISRAQNLYTQLQETLTEAPQLFGNLTPDQIQTYMAPLKTSFEQSLATAQTVMASRGMAASSTENAAIAAEQKKFQEGVFATGLDVGMKSQQAKAQSMQQQIAQLFGLGQFAQGEAGGAARQKSAQELYQSNLIASLPYFLRESGSQEAQSTLAAQRAREQRNTLLGRIGYARDVFNTSKGFAMDILKTPSDLASSFGGSSGGGTPYSPTSAPNLPASGSTLLPSSLSLTQPSKALFATP